MRTEVGIQQDLDYFASSGKKCATCVYGVRRKKKSEHLGWLIEFLAQKQQQSIKVFDMGLDFCKMEVQRRQNQKKMKFFFKVSLLYIAVSGVEELREEEIKCYFKC